MRDPRVRQIGRDAAEQEGLTGAFDTDRLAPADAPSLFAVAAIPVRPERPGGGWRVAVASMAVTLLLVALLPLVMGLPAKTDPWSISSISDGRVNVTFLDADGEVITHRGYRQEETVPLSEMPPYLPAAILAVEDRRFYGHWGIDMRGVVRATVRNLKAGEVVQGASTITQQLARNLYLNADRTFRRKAQEAALALWLDFNLPKAQILELYLNRVYLGAGAYGVEAAAQVYFNKSARDLTLAEAVMIAGLPKAPSRYSPLRNPDLALARASVVLDKLAAAGGITPAEAAAAKASPAVPSPQARARDFGAEYFIDWVFTQLPSVVDRPPRELVITTTLNRKLQRQAEAAVTATLDHVREPVHIDQGALVSMDHEGAVRAMVGGRDYLQSQFNRATQAERQPGSAFKPFVYLAALRNGYTPTTGVPDRPIRVQGWRPTNANGRYSGWIQLRNALAFSVNTVAVRLALDVGIGTVADIAHSLGITTRLPEHPSMALGAMEVRLLELTGAYVPISNGGYAAAPYGIEEVRTIDGELIYRHAPQYVADGERAAFYDDEVETEAEEPAADEDIPMSRLLRDWLVTPAKAAIAPPADDAMAAQAERRRVRVMTARESAQMSDMLRRAVAYGTGRRARLWTRPVAGKTGTTSDNRDAWFIGFTGDLVTGVWHGNDDAAPMFEGRGGLVQGGRQPVDTWRMFMAAAHEGLPARHLDGTLYTTPKPQETETADEDAAPDRARDESADKDRAGSLRRKLLDVAHALSHARDLEAATSSRGGQARRGGRPVIRDRRHWAAD